MIALRRFGTLLVLVVVGLTGIACGGGGPLREAEPVRCDRDDPDCIEVGIGEPIFLGTLLSRDRASGQDALASVRLAIDYLDGRFDGIDGTLLGHRIALIEEDDGCSAVDGRAGALRLLEEPDLLGVIGTSCSSAALGAASEVLSDADVPLISPSATAPLLTDPARSDRYFFRTVFNDRIQSSVIADFVYTRSGWRSAVVLALRDDAYSEQLGVAFTADFGRLGGSSETFPVDETVPDGRLDARIARAVARADVVFLPLSEPVCGAIAAALRLPPRANRTPMIVSEGCQTASFLEALGPRADGIFVAAPDFSYLEESPFYREAFLEGYRRREGADPGSPFHAMAFDAANLLLAAIQRTAVREPGGALLIDRSALRSALLQVEGYPGLSGTITCTPSGDCAQGARIAIYRAPDWPVVAGGSATPVFSQVKTLAQLGAGG
jgi:branched-chain amino acid transport system substrate-binding protein